MKKIQFRYIISTSSILSTIALKSEQILFNFKLKSQNISCFSKQVKTKNL